MAKLLVELIIYLILWKTMFNLLNPKSTEEYKKEVDEVMNILWHIWWEMPDQRLFQVLYNLWVFHLTQEWHIMDPFHLTNQHIISKLQHAQHIGWKYSSVKAPLSDNNWWAEGGPNGNP